MEQAALPSNRIAALLSQRRTKCRPQRHLSLSDTCDQDVGKLQPLHSMHGRQTHARPRILSRARLEIEMDDGSERGGFVLQIKGSGDLLLFLAAWREIGCQVMRGGSRK